MKKLKFLAIPVIVSLYALLYVATSKTFPCNTTCESYATFQNAVFTDHSYIRSTDARPPLYDTVMVFVDTTGITGMNWGLVADSICTLATNAGLPRRELFIIKYFLPHDTLARKSCP